MRKLFPLRKRLFSLPIVLCLASGLTGLAAMAPVEPFSNAANAQEVKLKIRGSGLPVPRFVTLKFNEVNMRAGPGREYPVLWAYAKTGLPLMVEAEFGAWRKVVDHEGTTGWMRGSVLSLRRMALVTEGSTRIYRAADPQSQIVAVAEKHALLELQSCPASMCKVVSDGVKGWIDRAAIWGVLKSEILD